MAEILTSAGLLFVILLGIIIYRELQLDRHWVSRNSPKAPLQAPERDQTSAFLTAKGADPQVRRGTPAAVRPIDTDPRFGGLQQLEQLDFSAGEEAN